MSTPEHELPPLPPLKEGYEDEFGQIDPQVYQAATETWPKAVRFGLFALHDEDLAFNLMIKAVANVSRSIAEGTIIKHLNSYLLTTFKHLVIAERAKGLSRSEPLSEAPEAATDIVADLDRMILAREIFSRLDNRDRTAIQLWMMGFSSEEIARILDLNPATVRQRLGRLKIRLRKSLAHTDTP